MFLIPFLLTSLKLIRKESDDAGRPLICWIRLALAPSASGLKSDRESTYGDDLPDIARTVASGSWP